MRQLPRHGAVAHRRQGVQVGDEVQRLALVLEIHELTDRAVVVAEVELAGDYIVEATRRRPLLTLMTHVMAA